ncbi:MAG: ATP-binding protein, partial [Pseudomonadota bacterium]
WLETWAGQSDGRAPITFDLIGNSGQIFNVLAQEMPDEGFVISFTDVTAEHQAAEALRELNRTLEQRVEERTEELGLALGEAERANESKNRFVAAASHDLLQPLSAAKLYLATLQDRDVDHGTLAISEKAASALRSAEDIIEALLDISKLDAGRATFDVRPFCLGATLGSIASEMAPLARQKGLDLRVVPSSLTIVSDPVFFRRILQNLVVNAIRYTDRGRVVVGVRRRASGRICLEVHDTGRGIRDEDQSRIFQEFARVDRANSGAEGIGLGLAIVERACASLGHQLRLRSTFGHGSCFSVGVTPSDCIAAEVIPVKEPEDALDLLRGQMLLLVENDPDLAQAMTLQFEGHGAHVLHCVSGEDALDLLEEIEIVPDAMLLDHQLGVGMTGLALYRRIRADYGAVPGIIISANRSAELVETCAALGVPFLRKPFEIKEFRKALVQTHGSGIAPRA